MISVPSCSSEFVLPQTKSCIHHGTLPHWMLVVVVLVVVVVAVVVVVVVVVVLAAVIVSWINYKNWP